MKNVVKLHNEVEFKWYKNMHDYATVDFIHLYYSGNIVNYHGEVTLAVF